MTQITQLKHHGSYNYYLNELLFRIGNYQGNYNDIRNIYLNLKHNQAFQLIQNGNEVEYNISKYMIELVRTFIQCNQIVKSVLQTYEAMLILLRLLLLHSYDILKNNNQNNIELLMNQVANQVDIVNFVGKPQYISDNNEKIEFLENLVFHK